MDFKGSSGGLERRDPRRGKRLKIRGRLMFSEAVGLQILLVLTTFLLASCTVDPDAIRLKPVEQIGTDLESNLSINWFGTASTLIDDGTNAVLIDPFVSREAVGPFSLLFGKGLMVDDAEVSSWTGRLPNERVRSIFVGHAHFDHVLDVAAFANKINADVWGSASSGRVVRAHGFANPRKIEVMRPVHVGEGFMVTAIPGVHGKPPFGIDLFQSDVAKEFSVPSAARAYGLGEIYTFLVQAGGFRILHVGSAGAKDGSLEGIEADILMLAIFGRGDTEKFLKKTVGQICPQVVIPIHYDWIFSSLEKPMKVARQAKLQEFINETERLYPNVTVAMLDRGKIWKVPVSFRPGFANLLRSC
jgi:L-ascorbate metabolism protein UlaG (beta-lactamase superfamily)